eukprot:11099133-Ditylum_brightwellii.AAC.1
MAPPGTKCYIHIKPHKRASWGFHAEDTWHDHNVMVPMVKPAECIEKAVKELIKAVKNNPTEGPPDYIEAVQQLRAVVFGEKQPKHTESTNEVKEVPKRNPSQKSEKPAEAKATPSNDIPTHSPVLILCNADEIEPQQETHED